MDHPSLTSADLALFAAYLIAVVLLGWWAVSRRRRGSADYILASRTLTLPMFVATLVPSFYGGTLGVGEFSYRYGLSTWLVQGVPYYLFALLYAWVLAGRVRVASGLTLPDHLEIAYGRPTAVLGALLVFILASPADEVLMLGTLTRWATGWPAALCIVLVTSACISFLFAGGLRSDVWANRLQTVFMFGGFAVILPFAYKAGGGLVFLRSHLPAAHLSPSGGNTALYILTWFFIALWTFVHPAFHQRVCAAESPRAARVGICVSVLFWLAFDFMTTAAGLYARALLPELKEPLMAYPALADKILPPVFKGIFLIGLASSTLAALQASILLAAVSLARDGAGRIWGTDRRKEETWMRWGLAASSAVSVLVALVMPSVVGIWYTLGSTIIPGLLVPLVSSYFQPLRMHPKAAFLCSLGGWLGALGAWAWGSQTPFYAGLGVSIAVWGISRITLQAQRASL